MHLLLIAPIILSALGRESPAAPTPTPVPILSHPDQAAGLGLPLDLGDTRLRLGLDPAAEADTLLLRVAWESGLQPLVCAAWTGSRPNPGRTCQYFMPAPRSEPATRVELPRPERATSWLWLRATRFDQRQATACCLVLQEELVPIG